METSPNTALKDKISGSSILENRNAIEIQYHQDRENVERLIADMNEQRIEVFYVYSSLNNNSLKGTYEAEIKAVINKVLQIVLNIQKRF